MRQEARAPLLGSPMPPPTPPRTPLMLWSHHLVPELPELLELVTAAPPGPCPAPCSEHCGASWSAGSEGLSGSQGIERGGTGPVIPSKADEWLHFSHWSLTCLSHSFNKTGRHLLCARPQASQAGYGLPVWRSRPSHKLWYFRYLWYAIHVSINSHLLQ